MNKSLIVISVLVLGLGLGACTKKSEEPAAEKPAAEEGSGDAPAKPAEKKPAEAAPAGDTSGKIGVPECDTYISKVQKCVSDKVPAAAQAALKDGFEKNIDAWKQAASTPQGKQALATACKTALDTAKTSLGAYGCEF